MIIRFLSSAVVLLLCVPMVTSAALTDFQLRLLVGDDSTPPTTPTITTLVPVATTQIDIEWSASTDDVYVSGYRLFRDGVFVATTTATQFSDTGLTPDTLYTYTVDAFDYSFNYATTSASSSTSTLSVYVPPPAPTPTSTADVGGATRVVPHISEVIITPAERTATIDFTAEAPVRYVIRFGRTLAYEQGSVSGGVYRADHSTVLYGLEPGTRYYVQIEVINGRGVRSVMKETSFQTKSSVAVSVPPNVRHLTAVISADDVRLAWENPVLLPGDTIRVLRSHLFFPTSPQDGVVVYSGVGSDVVDKGAVAAQPRQYYTVFVVRENGLSSSGAVVRVLAAGDAGLATTTPASPVPTTPVEQPASGTTADAINVVSAGVVYPWPQLTTLPAGQPFALTIPRELVPLQTKAVLVTLTSPTNAREVTQYLMKLHPNGSYYETEIIAPDEAGEGKISIVLYDFSLNATTQYEQFVQYITKGQVRGQMALTTTRGEWGVGAVLVLLLTLLGWFMYRLWRV